MAVADAQAQPAVSAPPDASRRRRVAILVALWLGLAIFYMLIQRGRHTPTVFNDEQVFGRAAENIAHGDGFTWRHVSAPLRSVYPFLIAPAWAVFKGATAYRVALVINALMMTAALFPTYLLARRVTGFGYAAVAGVVAVLIPSMVWSGMLMTESLAYPLAALALLAGVDALRRPGPRTAILAFIAIAAAASTRSQLLVLAPVFVGGIAVDILRFGRDGAGDRIRAHRFALACIAGGALTVAGLVLVGPVSSDTVFGPYAVSSGKSVDVGRFLDFLTQYVGGLSGAVLGLPLAAAIALTLRRANWRDAETGPLLAMAGAVVVLLIAIGAWFAAIESREVQERYVFYAMPVLSACWVGLPGRASPRAILLASLGLAVAVWVFFPGFIRGGPWEGWVQYGLQHFGNPKHVFLALVVVFGGATALATRLTGAERALLMAAPLVVLGLFTVQQGQRAANAGSRLVEAQIPRPFNWIDRATHGPAALMGLPNTSLLHIADFELWNQNLDRLFTFPTKEEVDLAGPSCHADVSRDGAISSAPGCPLSMPSNLVFAEERSRIAMQNAIRVIEPRLAFERKKREQFTRYGQLFVFHPGAVPRIRSLINGCGQDFCPGRATIQLWSRTSGLVRVTLRLQNLGGRARDTGFAGYSARAGSSTAPYDTEGTASLVIRAGPGTHQFVIQSRRRNGDPVSFDILAADYAAKR
jgi:hypothetical protein